MHQIFSKSAKAYQQTVNLQVVFVLSSQQVATSLQGT